MAIGEVFAACAFQLKVGSKYLRNLDWVEVVGIEPKGNVYVQFTIRTGKGTVRKIRAMHKLTIVDVRDEDLSKRLVRVKRTA